MSIKRYDTFYEDQPFENTGGRYVLYDDHVSELARLMERSMDGGEDAVAYEVEVGADGWTGRARVVPVGALRGIACFGPYHPGSMAIDECERLNEAYNLGRKSMMNSESLDRSSL